MENLEKINKICKNCDGLESNKEENWCTKSKSIYLGRFVKLNHSCDKWHKQSKSYKNGNRRTW